MSHSAVRVRSSLIANHQLIIFSSAILDRHPSLFAVDMAGVETNILRFRIEDSALSPQEFCSRMARVGEGEEAALGQGVPVLMYPHFENSVRAVWHLGISPEDTQLAIQKMQFVASQYKKEKNETSEKLMYSDYCETAVLKGLTLIKTHKIHFSTLVAPYI